MINPFNNANSSVTLNEKAILAHRIMSMPAYQGKQNNIEITKEQ